MKPTNTTVTLDTVSAIDYLSKNGFPRDFIDEVVIDKAVIYCSNKYLSKEINTLLYCSIINKIFYIDVIKSTIRIENTGLYSLLIELSELQYYDQVNDSKKMLQCLDRLHKYLDTKNRERLPSVKVPISD